MGVVSTLLARRWRTLQLVAVVALAVILITGALDLDDHTSRVITAATYSPFYLLKSSLLELSQKAVESQQLREKLVDASVKLSLLEEARRENARLRSLLGFEALSGFKIVPAKVVAVYGFELPTAALINRGWKDSIVVDQSIVNQEGLVGRVVAVSADFATVQLLTDPLNRVAARAARCAGVRIGCSVSSKTVSASCRTTGLYQFLALLVTASRTRWAPMMA